MRSKFLLTTAIAMLVAVSGTVHADDTDVYMNPGVGLSNDSAPLVMFSLDYRPNLGSTACNGNVCDTLIAEGYMSPTGPYTFFDVLRGALRKVMNPLEGVKVGLMMNHDHTNKCAGFGRTKCSNGGYILMGFQEFVAGDANGAKARFHQLLDDVPTPHGNKSHKYQGKELFFEFFRYLTGQGVYNSHNGWVDFGTNNQNNLNVDNPLIDWDTGIETGPANNPDYISPLSGAGECTSIYTINSMFQVSQQEADSDDAIEATISNGGFGSSQNDFPDVIQYLNDADLANGNYGTVPDLDDKQNVTSYFLIDPSHINTTTRSYAQAGGTGSPLELSEDPDELVATLQEIFKQILSVSTTFVAASVPVNVFNRAEIMDNVYIGLFQVDKEARPYWIGNIKKLKLVGGNSSSDGAAVVDASGNNAVAVDGRIRHDALTHWTDAGDLPPADEDAGEVNGKDGRSVARGGAGQQIPGYVSGSPGEANGLGGRTIYYDSALGSLAALNVDTVTATTLLSDLDAASIGEATELLKYARGLDLDDLDDDSNSSEARPWILGDPLHSRPLPLNYGALGGHGIGNPAIYVAVASNDGMLRMFRNTHSGGSESGEEVWAFMPRTSMPAQKSLRDNATGVRHPYTFDGSPVAYIEDKNHNGTIESGESAYLFAGLRRGGKAYYALDISNPDAPSLMWTIGKSGDFAELGYTFSTPRVGLIDTGSGPRPVLMFAGGYDTNKDTRGSVGTNDSEGNAIYVVDAETGSLIWKARGNVGGSSTQVFEHPQLVDSIPSALTVADTDGDSLTDRIIVGDTGGNLWRADLKGTSTGDWKLTLLASLGRHATGASGKGSDRRFFHRPDLVQTMDGNGNFDAVLIGSGDRADPLDSGGVTSNWFYMFKDRNTAVGSAVAAGYEHGDFADVTDNCLQEGADCGLDLSHGWRLQMEDTSEKILATPTTIAGNVFFTSFLPKAAGGASACSPTEGAGRLYSVNLQDARSVMNYDSTDDDPDNPDAPTSKSDRSSDLSSAGIPAEVVSIPPNKILRPDLQIENIKSTTRWRTYWYLAEDSDL